MSLARDCGILLHPTSLPGPHGCGEIGGAARAWIDALAEMGQSIWQILPLGPTGWGNSPYQSPSSFAANPLLIDLDDLVADGLLTRADLAGAPPMRWREVDFEAVRPWRLSVLARAASAFERDASSAERAAEAAFQARSALWLEDWSSFVAVKEEQEDREWTAWPAPLRNRERGALAAARERCAAAVRRAEILQHLFDRQWSRLRVHASARGVRILGDLPIFVAHDSADVWAAPDLFLLDASGAPTVVAGVPPDAFSATGQRWGNPLYRWPAHAGDGFRWWQRRFTRVLDWVDVVRIDHFRGLVAAWEIPATENTATRGRWVPAPGAALLTALAAAVHGGGPVASESASARSPARPRLPVVAEDLGLITPDVTELREAWSLPGMRVLQFGFDGDPDQNPHHPDALVPDCVAYTGTHDNDTTLAWLAERRTIDATLARELALPPSTTVVAQRDVVDAVLRRHDPSYVAPANDVERVFALVRLLYESTAGLVVVPLQDVLGAGSASRMNFPGHPEGNWRWRFAWSELTPALRARLLALARDTGRATRPHRPRGRPARRGAGPR